MSRISWQTCDIFEMSKCIRDRGLNMFTLATDSLSSTTSLPCVLSVLDLLTEVKSMISCSPLVEPAE